MYELVIHQVNSIIIIADIVCHCVLTLTGLQKVSLARAKEGIIPSPSYTAASSICECYSC